MGKVFPINTMKAHRRNGSTVPLDASGWLSTTPPHQYLTPRKEPWYPLKKRLNDPPIAGLDILLPQLPLLTDMQCCVLFFFNLTRTEIIIVQD